MSKLDDGMAWFKQTFGPEITPAVAGTAFDLHLMTALATQETFEIWGNVFTSVATPKILEICVGDTIDAPGRSAFPTSKKALLTDPNGARLFEVARGALEEMGRYNATYHKIADANPNKFCHGFGIFQYDIQFARQGHDPDFFLERRWLSFGECLNKALTELRTAQGSAGLAGKATLTPLEQAHVAIAYNTGSFKPAKGLKQGYRDGTGKYYGELIFDYINRARAIP